MMSTDKVIFGLHIHEEVLGLSCLNIPGLFSCIDDDWTVEQIIDNIKDALSCYEDELERQFVELSVQDIRALADEYEDGYMVYDRVNVTLEVYPNDDALIHWLYPSEIVK